MEMKAQISIVESVLFIVLFLSFAYAYGTIHFQNEQQIETSIDVDTMMDLLYARNDTHQVIEAENLSTTTVTGNWTNVTNMLSVSFSSYEIIVYNLSTEKYIVSCNATYSKRYSERLYAISNNSNFDFRVLRVGVCS